MMTALSLLALSLLAVANPDVGNFSSGSGYAEMPAANAAVYTITVLNTWPIPAGQQALGLDYIDYWYADNIVAYVSQLDDTIYWMDADNGAAVTPAWDTADTNTNAFGVAQVPETPSAHIHVNDWSMDYIYHRAYNTSWASYNALCDNKGRGMDYDDASDKIFEIYTNATPGSYTWYVAMYTPGSSSGSTYQLNCNVSSDWWASGVTLFPQWGGGTGIACTMYDSAWICFFNYPSAPGQVYYGYGILPYDSQMESSLGLTYSEELGVFFHAWSDASDNYYISKLDVDAAALDQATWAEIKAAF